MAIMSVVLLYCCMHIYLSISSQMHIHMRSFGQLARDAIRHTYVYNNIYAVYIMIYLYLHTYLHDDDMNE
jgi:hypothetical protein